MSATLHTGGPDANAGGVTLQRDVGLPGAIAVAWTAAGGFLLGGFLVAAQPVGDRSVTDILILSGVLFIVGCVLGFAHGAALGWLGRPETMSPEQTRASLLLAAVYALPVGVIGGVVAGWIAFARVILADGNPFAIGLSAAAALGAAAAVATALVQGWRGFRNAYGRWPDARWGTVLVAGVLVALLAVLLAPRPALWGLTLRLSPFEAVLLALFGCIWVAGPLVTLALDLVARVPSLSRAAQGGPVPADAAGVAAGLAVGVALGFLALPFFGAPLRVTLPGAAEGLAGALSLAAGYALLDEVLLRLFLVGAVARVLLQRPGARPAAVGAAAVGVAALVGVALYLPGVYAVGFPSLASAAAYVGLRVLLPGLAFGALFWWRGLGASFAAHVAMLALILLRGG